MQTISRIIKQIISDLNACRIPLCILGIYLLLTQLIFGTVCPFVIITGFPCPACGLTRAGLALITGQFTVAWEYNATIYLWAPLLLCGFIFRYILQKRTSFLLPASIPVSLITIGYYLWRYFFLVMSYL